MIRKLLLAACLSIVSTAAFAVCPTPLTVKDAAGTTQNITTVVDGSGNCMSSIGGWAGGSLGAMANYGTSPGAVLVPGVNAFITNTNANGQAVMASSSPVVIASDQSAVPASVTKWATGTLGAMANYGTSPGAVLAPGVNAFVTNTNTNITYGDAITTGTLSVGSPSAALGFMFNGTTYDRFQDDANKSLKTALVDGVGGTNRASVVAVSVAPVTATNPALVVDLRPDSPGIIATGGATTANSVSTILNSQYPVNSVTTAATPAVAKATGTTSAVTGTIAAVASATNYLCGFDVSYIGGTAAISPVTVTGLLGGTWTYQLDVASATVGKTYSKEFTMCVPASATNTAISVVTTADGTATAVDVQLHGYTQ